MVTFSNNGMTLVATVSGELDHHNEQYMRERIDREVIKAMTKNLILDFSELEFMDSSGVGVIIGRYKNIQKLNGKVAVTGLNEQIKKVFQVSGLLKIIPLYDTIDDAINKM